MQKRGQVSLFIIVGIILVLAVSLLYFVLAPDSDPGVVTAADMAPIRNYIDLCAKSSAEDAVRLLGLQGGYINVPSPYFESVYTDIAYWYYTGDDTYPTLEKMEQELSGYMNENLLDCIDDLRVFSDMGYAFSFGEISTQASIGQNNVEFNINYPITVIKDNRRTEISTFYQNIPVRLGYIYDISREIVSGHVEDPDWIDVSYLLGLDITPRIYPYEGSRLVYSLRDNVTITDFQLEYLFLFAAQFD